MSVSYGGDSITFADGSVQSGGWTGMRNRIINGAMVIDQRSAGASFTPTANGYGSCDRWLAAITVASKFTVQQNAGSVTPPAGFKNYLGVTSSSAYSVLTADIFSIGQYVEGLNMADFAWGTASAATVTLSFWVRSSLTGTFGGALQNSAQNRSYPFSYTISSANTWEQKTITIAGDTSGTWLTTNGIGARLFFSVGTGATYSGTVNVWAGTTYWSVPGATSVVGTNGATFYITGVQLERGSTASSFEYRPYGTELQLCQRYYLKNTGIVDGGGVTFATVSRDVIVGVKINFMTEMRSTPTLTMLGTTSRSGGDANGEEISTIGFSWGRKKTGSGSADAYAFATGGFEVTAEL
jgi:hypothetical protein